MSTCVATSSRFALPAAVLALGGCALIFEGTTQEVAFTSVPPGARFSVGGREAATPTTLELPKEDYVLVFSKPGFHPREFELKRRTTSWFYGTLMLGAIPSAVDVVTGAWQEFQTDAVHVVLEPLPGTIVEEGDVELASTPAGAELLLGELLQGRTPLKLKLGWSALEEEKALTFRLPGHRQKTLPLRRGEASLRALLEPEPVTVRVHVLSAPEGADVSLDGRRMGRTPLYLDVVWLPGDAPKELTLARAGYRTEKRPLSGPSQTRAEAELAEVFEELPLDLEVFPPGAQVEIDGRPAEPGGLRLRWSPSLQRHSLRITHPGYRAETRELSYAERRNRLNVVLRPLLPKAP